MPRAAVFAVLTFLYMPAPALWSQAPGLAQGPPAWLAADTAARTVTVTLDVTAPAGAPSALIAGHRAGEVEIVVPLNWTVTWHWQSSDSAASHSLVVMAEREKLPLQGGQPALDNAMTRMVTAGLKAGQTDVTTFAADQAGWYWLLCGVPGHALKGEWLGLRVDPDAKGPDVRSKK
ncbi:MAG: sulfocyanin-like copper-binding protein [Deltaproteobacteria bacterium]